MGPYGSVWAHIKTGRSPMAYDHFCTPLDPQMAHKNQKMTNKIKKYQNSNFVGPCCYPNWLACKSSLNSELVVDLHVKCRSSANCTWSAFATSNSSAFALGVALGSQIKCKCTWICICNGWRTKLSNFSGEDVGVFFNFYKLFWVRRGLKMIVSHRAPSSLNMSSYRAIRTHFRPNPIFFINLILQLLAAGTCPQYIQHTFTIDSQ